MRRNRAGAVAILLAASLAACTDHSASSRLSLRQDSAGVTVTGSAEAFPNGQPVVRRQRTPTAFGKLIAGPVVEIGKETQPAKPVTLSFPPLADRAPAHIAYRDDESGWWIPVPTAVDAKSGRLTATVDHFSWWTTIRDTVQGVAGGASDSISNSASWLEYEAGLIVGVRGGKPTCSGGLPAWVKGDIIANPDSNAELFACGERDGSKLSLKVVNNRGYPVTVEFTKPYESVSTELPASLGDLVQKAANPRDGSNTRVFLVGKERAEVVFAQPKGVAGVVEGYARRDAGTLLTDVVFDLLSTVGADVPVGGGKTLGISSLECLASDGKAVTGTAEGMQTRNRTSVEESLVGLRGCVNEVVDTELKRAVPTEPGYANLRRASRFLKYLQAYNFEMLGLDAFVNDATPEAALVDVSFRWQGQLTVVTLDARGISVAGEGFRNGSSGFVVEKALTGAFGSPDKTKMIGASCEGLADYPPERILIWGGLIVYLQRTPSLQLQGWAIQPGKLPGGIRTPYGVTTSTSVRGALQQIPQATGQWDDTLTGYWVSTPAEDNLTWAGDHEDGSGPITFITNDFHPCE